MAGFPANASLILVYDMILELIRGMQAPNNNAPATEQKPREHNIYEKDLEETWQ